MSKTKERKKTTVKTAKKTSDKKATKTSVKTADKAKLTVDKPSLESILREGDRVFSDIVMKTVKLAECLVRATEFYGQAGRRAFRARFPLTDNTVRNLDYIGHGLLLPQFVLCSDRFVHGLVDLQDSMSWQYKLLCASKNGMINIRKSDGSLTEVPIDQMEKSLADGVLTIMTESDKDMSVDQFASKIRSLMRDVRQKFARIKRNLFEISMKDGHKVVRFFRSTAVTAEDLRKIVEQLEA